MTYQKAATILANPDRYSRREVEKARALVRDVARNEKRQRLSSAED